MIRTCLLSKIPPVNDLSYNISETLFPAGSLGQVNAQQRGNTRAAETAFALE